MEAVTGDMKLEECVSCHVFSHADTADDLGTTALSRALTSLD